MKSKLFYLLLAKNSSANKTELESESLPYLFKSNGHRLRNYRIYGAEGGVGDEITDENDDNYGKYAIPVTVRGKNLFDFSAWAASLTSVYRGTFSVSGDSISVTATEGSAFTIPCVDGASTYKMPVVGGNTYTLSWEADSDLSAPIYVFENGSTSNYHQKNNQNGKYITFSVAPETTFITLRFAANNVGDTITYSKIQFESGSASSYEQYLGMQTKYIYLDEPLAEDEYIDFREQKRFNSDDTSEIVSLPALPSIDGTNIISVETSVQPEKVYVQGNVEEIPSVSLQALNLSPRNLQMDFEDDDLQLDVMPIERPNLQLNDISETVGGEEVAE